MPNCPECHNPDHVYLTVHDPKYGWAVLCTLHGVQSVELDEHKKQEDA